MQEELHTRLVCAGGDRGAGAEGQGEKLAKERNLSLVSEEEQGAGLMQNPQRK